MAFSNCVMFALYVGTIRAGKTFCIAASAACCYLWCFLPHFFTWRRRRRLKKKKTLKRQQHNSTTHTHACTHTLLHGVRVCETRRAYTWTLACIDEVLHYYILKCAHVCVCVCVRMHHHTAYGHGKRVVTYFGLEPVSSAHWRLLCRWLLFCGVQSWRFFTFFSSPSSFFILQLQQSTNLSLLKLYVKPTEGGGDELRARREATVAATLTVATANATYLSWFSFDMVPSI